MTADGQKGKTKDRVGLRCYGGDIGRLNDIYDFFDDFNKCIYLWKASNFQFYVNFDHDNFLGCFIIFALAKLKEDLTETNESKRSGHSERITNWRRIVRPASNAPRQGRLKRVDYSGLTSLDGQAAMKPLGSINQNVSRKYF